jgi:hypothetical protein
MQNYEKTGAKQNYNTIPLLYDNLFMNSLETTPLQGIFALSFT